VEPGCLAIGNHGWDFFAELAIGEYWKRSLPRANHGEPEARESTSLMAGHRGAQATDVVATPSIVQAPLWGLGKTIALEHPELNCAMIDLDLADDHQSQHLLTELYSNSLEDQVALRQHERYVARLGRFTPAPTQTGSDHKPVSLTTTARGSLII